MIDSTAVSANASLSSVTAIRWTPQQYWSQLGSAYYDATPAEGNGNTDVKYILGVGMKL